MVDGCRRCRASRALILQPKVVKNKLMSFSDEKQVETQLTERIEISMLTVSGNWNLCNQAKGIFVLTGRDCPFQEVACVREVPSDRRFHCLHRLEPCEQGLRDDVWGRGIGPRRVIPPVSQMVLIWPATESRSLWFFTG